MICLRCAHCCLYYSVIIIDDPKKGFHIGNLIHHNGQGTPCKHLRGDQPGEYSCSIHDKEWYGETPCAAHTQIEDGNRECRIGAFMMKNEKEMADG